MRPTTSRAAAFLMLLALLCYVFLMKLTAIPIRIWDEARLANSALHMHLHGNWLIPHYDGAPDMWSVKPPLMIWLQALMMKMVGVNEYAVRLPAALASILTGLSVFWFCTRTMRRTWLAYIAGAVFATTFAYAYLHAGRYGEYDGLLVLFTTLSCFCMYLHIESRRNKWLHGFWIFLVLAVLTKGIAGMLLLPGLAIYVLWSRSLPWLARNRSMYIGAAGFIIMVGGYYLLRNSMNPGYLRAVWENELGGRYLSTLEQHKHPFLHYFDYMRNWRYPAWFYLLLPAFAAGFFFSETSRRMTIFNLAVALSYLLIISASQTKLEWYDLPAYPFLAVQVGLFLYEGWNLLTRQLPWQNQAVSIAGIGCLGVMLLIPLRDITEHIRHFSEKPWDVEPHRQGYFLQNAIRERQKLDDYLFLYDGYNGQIGFYIRKMQAEGSRVRLESDPSLAREGMHVVVSQDAVREKLQALFELEKIREAYECTEYRVKRKL